MVISQHLPGRTEPLQISDKVFIPFVEVSNLVSAEYEAKPFHSRVLYETVIFSLRMNVILNENSGFLQKQF
jgi:hypothetical protein